MQGFLASWMPKLGGFVIFMGATFGELAKNFDDNAATNADWNIIYLATTTFVTLLSVRQNGVSSESVGCARKHSD